LDGNNLSQATEWIQTINKFLFLKVLWLSSCDLSSINPPSLSFTNSSKSLAVIDLSQNYLASSTFNWLSNFNNSLVHLNLRSNWINSSENLDWLSYLSSLEYLDLSRNNLSQTIDWLQVLNRLPRLHELLLSSCSLSIIGSPSLSLVNSSKSLLSLISLSTIFPLQYSIGWPTSVSALLILTSHLTIYKVQFQMLSQT
jgi:hypothetical protein